jgi:hypothetical protein
MARWSIHLSQRRQAQARAAAALALVVTASLYIHLTEAPPANNPAASSRTTATSTPHPTLPATGQVLSTPPTALAQRPLPWPVRAAVIAGARPPSVFLQTPTPTPTATATPAATSETILSATPTQTIVPATETARANWVATILAQDRQTEIARPATATRTPTVTPTLPPLTVSAILDPQGAITYSLAVLTQGYDWETYADNPVATQVLFPSGDVGMFVALGFSAGPKRGYRFLYRIRDDNAELVDMERDFGLDWGIRDIRSGEVTGIETVQLFSDSRGQPGQTLKITGAGHAGIGMWDVGAFRLILITDAGMKVIFEGEEEYDSVDSYGDKPYIVTRQYSYEDLSGDGQMEIIENAQTCYQRLNEQKNQWQQTTCEPATMTVYRFNESTYVADPALTATYKPSSTPTPPPLIRPLPRSSAFPHALLL